MGDTLDISDGAGTPVYGTALGTSAQSPFTLNANVLTSTSCPENSGKSCTLTVTSFYKETHGRNVAYEGGTVALQFQTVAGL